MRKLFHGLQRAHGVYDLTGEVSPKGKAQGKASTHATPVTPELWYQHLEGERGLGIVPIMDDATCGFGAIDIDQYPLDLPELERKIRSLHLPLVVCRTKSGGAHCYLFLKYPVRADLVRRKLAEWSIAIGFPSVEVYPKQDAMGGEADVGNWINLPYFDVENTLRYGIYNGQPLPISDFLDLAESYAQSDEELRSINLDLLDELADAPPCLQTLCHHKVPEGGRNEVMFALGVYAKLKYGAAWESKLDEFNREYFEPPLGYKEIGDVVKTHRKKDYFYTCKKEPLKAHCSKDICRQREFGVSLGEASDPGVLVDGITQITTDPPIWFVTVNGQRMQFASDDLLNQGRFARRVLDELRIVPQPLKPHLWRNLINDLLRTAEVVIAPKDAGPEGLFWHYLEQFCTQRAQARQQDELLLGKPWTDRGRTYFRSADLMRYLELNKFRDFKPHQVYAALRGGKGVKHEQFNIKGACVQCWSIDEFQRQDKPFDIPEGVGDVEC